MELFSRYKMLRKIGSGGMATVYLAADSVLQREVALKIIHPHLMDHVESVKRFENEARAIASLAHENIVKLYDYGEDMGRRCLVMEFVKGSSLAELVQERGVLPNLVALEIVRQTLSGLAEAHAKGMIHRDVKPSNIMIDAGGCVRIMDFGIAYIADQEGLTLTGTFLGSPNYISPEQAEGLPLSGKSDIFSLGAMVYQGVTDVVAFDADNPHAIIKAIAAKDPTSAHRVRPQVLEWVSGFISECLAKDPALRPDALSCTSKIDGFCESKGVRLGKERVVAFLRDPKECAAREAVELYEAFARTAAEHARRNRYVPCVRALDQAKVFSSLKAHEAGLLRSMGRRRTLGKAVAAVLAGVLLVAAGRFLVVPAVESHRLKSQSREVASPGVRPDSVASVSQVQIQAPMIISAQRPAIEDAVKPHAAIVPPDVEVQSPLSGFLRVRTNPPWVKILVDGDEVGETPKRAVMRLAPGSHQVLLVKSGFAPETLTVTIAQVDTQDVTVRLEPVPE